MNINIDINKCITSIETFLFGIGGLSNNPRN